MRVFVRSAASERTKILVLPPAEAITFDEFKARCVAKLGLLCTRMEAVTILLGSSIAANVRIEEAPEVEALDEISPEDHLIILLRGSGDDGESSGNIGAREEEQEQEEQEGQEEQQEQQEEQEQEEQEQGQEEQQQQQQQQQQEEEEEDPEDEELARAVALSLTTGQEIANVEKNEGEERVEMAAEAEEEEEEVFYDSEAEGYNNERYGEDEVFYDSEAEGYNNEGYGYGEEEVFYDSDAEGYDNGGYADGFAEQKINFR